VSLVAFAFKTLFDRVALRGHAEGSAKANGKLLYRRECLPSPRQGRLV